MGSHPTRRNKGRLRTVIYGLPAPSATVTEMAPGP